MTSMPCMLLSELIPHLLEVSRPLDPYIIMLYWFLDLKIFLESMKHDHIAI